jgi:hypothetical protein
MNGAADRDDLPVQPDEAGRCHPILRRKAK